jgi:hypothetical protein
MNKVFAVTLVAAAVGFSSIAAQAMPIGSNQTQDRLVVQVAGGCGAGFHRGPYGGCRRNGYYEGRYWGTPGVGVVVPGVGVGVGVGPCGGRGAHQVCGPYGNCRMVCNY